MNERMLEIVQLLISREMTIEELAGHFSVSSRTIRNDLHTINDWLKRNGLDELELRRGGKIIKKASFQHVNDVMSEVNLNTYHLSKKERIMIASAMLVSSCGYITLSTIADCLYVSRVTIINDLEDIKKYIRTHHLEVISQPNRGLRVDGKESDKRLFLIKAASKSNEQNMISQYLSLQAGNRTIIQKIVLEQEQNYEAYLSDTSFSQLLLYLGVMINRNLQGEYVEVYPRSESDKYPMAQEILKYLTQYCQINTTRDEVHFLSDFLGKLRYVKQKQSAKGSIKIQMITRRFIDSISQDLESNLNNDYEFFENLSNHLISVFRSDASAFPENAVIKEVMEDNPKIEKAVKKNLNIITKFLERQLTDNEIGYIAVHVCAALERKKNKEIAFHVIVACHAGVGTSRLLLEKLKQHFNFQIVDIITSHEASRLKPEQADLVISTVALKNCKIETIVVSPLLGDEDYIRVGNKIDMLRNSRNLPTRMEAQTFTAKGLMDQLTPILYENVPEQADDLNRKIRKVVRKYFEKSIDAEEDIFSPYLHHLLPAGHIQLDVECADWKEAVTKSAIPLLEMGYIEQRYIDAMIENIQENGPYIVLTKGFAVPHEGVDAGSIKVGMNLIRLKNPVLFDVEEYDPVEFVCCLSAVDHKTHLKAFFNLVNLLKEPKFREELHNSKTSQEMAKIIEKYEISIM